MVTTEPDSATLPVPQLYDLTDHNICQKCGIRYIKPTDYWKSGPQKGERHTNCGVCMGRVAKKRFPSELLVPKDVQESRKDIPNAQNQCLLQLDVEQQSLLMHSDAVVKSFQPETTLFDLPRAHSDVQWNAIVERFRDIHCLQRLFQGFSALAKKYTIEVNTIAPIGLLAVSLNNHAIQAGEPFKLAWLPIPEKLGRATLYLAFGAWLPEEKAWWAQATPHDRLKGSSAWECKIRKSSKVLTIAYDETSAFECNVHERMRIPVEYQDCLLWHQQIFEGEEAWDQGQFVFPDGQEYAFCLQCDSSAQLFDILCNRFHSAQDKLEWHYVQAEGLGKLQRLRAPDHKSRAKVQTMITERRRN